VVKRGGKGEKEGVKKPPCPVWSPLGDQAGELQKLPRGGELPLLPCAWAVLKAAPRWVHTGQVCVSVVGPDFDCPLCEGSILLPSFWAVAGGGGFASRS